ncbi:MAG: ATP-binding cassette domain-containing protein [Petrotogales bacterium]
MEKIKIRIRTLNKVYNTSPPLKALENVNLDIYENEFVCVIGPSGCGKSTLLKVLAGFEPYGGDALVEGKPVRNPGPDRFVVHQEFDQLLPWKTVYQNIDFGLFLKDISEKESKKIVNEIIDLVGLKNFENSYPHELSGGSTINEAIITGDLQFASMGIAPAVIGIDQGVGAKIFASMGSKEHKLWTWRNDINSISDIVSLIENGTELKINLLKENSIEEMGMAKALVDLNSSLDYIMDSVVYLSHPDAFSSMLLHEIDVDFTGEPYNSEYDKDEDFHQISSDSEIWGQALPDSSFVARTDFVDQYPDVASAVWMAWCEATNWIINNQEEASYIIGAVLEYEPNEAWDLWQQSNLLWNPTYGLVAVKGYASTLYDFGFIEKSPTIGDLMFAHTRGAAGI